MKKLLLVVSFLLGITYNVISDSSITLGWCPSPSAINDATIMYRVYYGSTNFPVSNWSPTIYDTNQPPCSGIILTNGTNWYRSYTNSIDVNTNLTAIISNLVVGSIYYFSVKAHDTNGSESDFSSEIMYVTNIVILSNLPPTKVQGFQTIKKP